MIQALYTLKYYCMLIAYFGLKFHTSLNSRNTKTSNQWGLMGVILIVLHISIKVFCKNP